jgi:thioredoxin-related protein
MKKILFLSIALVMMAGFQFAGAQEAQAPKKIYDPEADAKKEIAQAVEKAGQEGKHVIVQIGGNWCGWCLRFHAFINEDPEIKKFLDDNFVYALLNYSQENKNLELLKQYNNPGRFGFPVFLVLDGKGNLIHTQDSGLLEEGKGYNKVKVMNFFRNWTVKALDTSNLK